MKLVLVLFALVAATTVAAFAASDTSGSAPAVQVVGGGLNNPRGVAVGPDGTVYVAEAGRGGSRCEGKGDNEQCLGATGAVSKVAGGRKIRIAGGLFSGAGKDGSFAGGVDGVAVGPRGEVYAIMSYIPNARRYGAAIAKQSGNLLRIGPHGAKIPVGNAARIELSRNPDGRERNPNPYGVAVGPAGPVVTDAGANDLLAIGPGGRVSLLAVFPRLRVGKRLVDPVPTSVTVGPDGAYYVGELGGEGIPGAANVMRVVPGQAPTVYAKGFTAIVGVAFGPDGSLYVAELLKKGLGQLAKNDFRGALIRVSPSGRRVELAPGRVMAAGGVAVDQRTGAVYVSTFSLLPHRGQVLRVLASPSFTG